jgi:2-methylcitrate dehydratase PrpD
MPLVKVSLDEEIEKDYPRTMGCVVRATTRDGQTYEGRVQFPKGEPENMLLDSEFEYKFRRLTDGVIVTDRVDQIIDMALRLEEIEDISSLVRLTAKDQN